MRPRMKTRAIAALALTLALSATLVATSVAGHRPSVRVTPRTVDPGETLRVTGKGWPKRSKVALFIGVENGDADRVRTVRTSRRGGFRTRLRISREAEPGRYVILACQRGCRTKALRAFGVAGEPRPEPEPEPVG